MSTDVVAQISATEASGLVGKSASIYFVLNAGFSGDSIQFESNFKFEDPTVFYPQRIEAFGESTLLFHSLERITDTTWSISFAIEKLGGFKTGDTVASLAGECLAGADSTTLLTFSEAELNSSSVLSFESKVTTVSVGPNLPYVRPPTLDPGRPNPTTTGRTITWGFRIDELSEVCLVFYTILGEEIGRTDFGIIEKGVYVTSYVPSIELPTGIYVVRLITNSGEATESMRVVR